MRIGENIANMTNYQKYTTYSTKDKDSSIVEEPVMVEKEEKSGTVSELETYKQLCSMFPDVTFRLSDKTSQYSFYENGMHQVGQNFGGHGQCSIDIDISVIRRMQMDEEYAFHVRGYVETIERNYSEYEAQTQSDGFVYTCANLTDEGGKLTSSTTSSMQPFSTEEEIKEMYGLTTDISDRALNYVNKVKNDLLEDYMAIQDKEENE